MNNYFRSEKPTKRELEAMMLSVTSYTSKEASAIMGVTEHTYNVFLRKARMRDKVKEAGGIALYLDENNLMQKVRELKPGWEIELEAVA